MTDAEAKKAVEILGGQQILRPPSTSERRSSSVRGRSRKRRKTFRGPKVDHELVQTAVERTEMMLAFDAADDRTRWTQLIRGGIPSKALENTAARLGISISELSQSLGLPARTMHRRLEKGERLSPEETERSLRAARALAKAQQLLGDENGRAWLLEPCRGLSGEKPITLLDTADGFTAVIDELGRLEYGVIS